jgi:hypothetical protein
MAQKTVNELRKANLAMLVKQWGGLTNLAKKLKHSGPSYLSQLLSASRPITEKTARSIERLLDLPVGWLDQDHNSGKPPPPVDQSLVTQVVLAVGAVLEDEKLQLSPGKFADLVTHVYEQAVKNGVVEETLIYKIVRLMK